jgi:cation diffusion facilitator CzcD-associated flavoprotein CzcO
MSIDEQAKRFDVIIVGAGISGIGSAYHLRKSLPNKSFAVIEANESFGGTWLLHKFPGIRSDSDLYTFGFRFKPWLGKPIATRAEILHYLGETISENNLDRHIHYNHRILRAEWSSADEEWILSAERTDTGEPVTFVCNFLWSCQGYYRHGHGHTPEWPGMADFKGPIVHPQSWPEDLDLTGKRVVCIGSGATAATIVPSIAGQCAHVTMLQRSPTYFIAGRNTTDRIEELRRADLSDMEIHQAMRAERIKFHTEMTRRSFEDAENLRGELLQALRAHLPEDLIEKHFTPRYRPWQQRVALVPDADFFHAIDAGQASVVTDEIETFTEQGIRLKSGASLDVDIVITATGFDMCVMGDVPVIVDGRPFDCTKTVAYRSMMFPGVPNLIWAMGCFRGSWTLRVELISDFVCSLLRHMDEIDASRVEVRLRPEDEDQPLLDWIANSDFNPGYLLRSMHRLPKRIDKPEWSSNRHYSAEAVEFPRIDFDGPEFVYRRPLGGPGPKDTHAALPVTGRK